MQSPRISHGSGATLFDTEGRAYIDLFSANGVAWLGHAEPTIAAAIDDQLRRVWATGALPTEIREQATDELENLLPADYRVAGFYSTGAEALEFAARVARVATGRNGLAGFERSMHGKTTLASFLGWDNRDGASIADCARLPYPPTVAEAESLAAVETELLRGATAAICFEPLQGSGGGFSPSGDFVEHLRQVTMSRGVLLLFDELLTGLFRTGPAFAFESSGVRPDLVLVGKSLGNGFPVSALVVREPLEITPAMLPGSTFAGNPLAAAAVSATLRRLSDYDMPQIVGVIGETISRSLSPLKERGVALRGKGAFWLLTTPPDVDMPSLASRIYARGVAIGYAGRQIRLLPPAVIERAALRRACELIREEVEKAIDACQPEAGAT